MLEIKFSFRAQKEGAENGYFKHVNNRLCFGNLKIQDHYSHSKSEQPSKTALFAPNDSFERPLH